MTSKTPAAPPSQADERRARLAAELRANLQKRKAQARSRCIGAADERPDGLGAADPAPSSPRK